MDIPLVGRAPKGARIVFAALALSLAGVSQAAGAGHGAWGLAIDAETIPGTSSELNTPSNDGCPIESPNGLRLYTATNRPGGLGGIDIWMAERASRGDPFGAPVNLGAPVNSEADDFCPTPISHGRLLFVSTRLVAEACGGADIYLARHSGRHGWKHPRNLGCQVNGVDGEAGPSFFRVDGTTHLYFSSGPDIYESIRQADGRFGPRQLVTELNTAGGEFRPNVTANGLEIVFDSDRAGGLGGQDLYFATRSSVNQPWSIPQNAGSNINTAASETRGSFSRDRRRLYFGRSPGPQGGSDIFVSTR